MKTLVLCIDRDNDLGRKTKYESPIIGRKANLAAAQALILADPEDSDANCLFAAIATYDRLKDAEIAMICGDINVGIESDMKLASQLDEVLSELSPESAIVVTDGAEDEYIIPIIESRVKIDSIKRVVVKQSQTLEGTYYLIKRLMDDEKMQRRFVLPLALILLVWGVTAIFGSMSWGIATTLIILALYLLGRVFHLERALYRVGVEVITGLKIGKMMLFSTIIAVFIIIISFIFAVRVLEGENYSIAEYVIRFIVEILWYIVAAILLVALGRFIDAYFKEREILWTYAILPFTLVAFGLILSASLTILIQIIHRTSLPSILNEYVISIPFLARIIGGLLVAFIGSVLYHIAEDTFKDEDIGEKT